MFKKKVSEEDDARLGKVVDKKSKKFHWTLGRFFLISILYLSSLFMILLALYPIFQGDIDPKILANQLFSLMHIFYMISFSAVKKNKQYFFWSASYFVLDAITFLFFFHDDIFY